MASFTSILPGVNTKQNRDGFSGPGVYRIVPCGQRESALKVFNTDDVRVVELNLDDSTQRWTIEQWGENFFKLFVESPAFPGKVLALEAFPRDGVAKPRPGAGINNKDQLWKLEHVDHEGCNFVRFSCESQSRGLVFLQVLPDGNGLSLVTESTPAGQLFRLDRLDKRTAKLGFPGPGKYRIQSMSPHAVGKVLEAFPKHNEIRPRDPPSKDGPDNIDQLWNFVDQGDYFRITCLTAKDQHVALEAFPRDNMVRPRDENPTAQDQWWNISELGDGKTIKISCQSKSRGLVCLELPQGGTFCTVGVPSTSLTQNFSLIPLFEPPKAFNGPGAYRIMNARSLSFLEAFPQQQLIKLQPSSTALDQRWNIERVATCPEDGDMFKIQCNSKSGGLIAWEAFPRDDCVRPQPATSKANQDQLWYIEELGDGLHIRIFCCTNSRGKVYLEVPLGLPHVTVRAGCENPGQLFRLERLGI